MKENFILFSWERRKKMVGKGSKTGMWMSNPKLLRFTPPHWSLWEI